MVSQPGNKQFQYTYCPISQEVKAIFGQRLVKGNLVS